AGAAAGLSVDLALYPLDTIKTRLQSAEGFWKTGGFRGIYRGIGSIATGSMPSAGLFFCTYETVKHLSARSLPEKLQPVGHSLAASCGEIMACFVRVPTEVIKQRAQASHSLSSRQLLIATVRQEGFSGLYRGFGSTVMREVPFSFLQFPIWEFFKKYWAEKQGHSTLPWQSAVCGALSGGLAAGITTPLDVAKTRIMLAERNSVMASANIIDAMRIVYSEKQVKGLFAGITPRMLWISIGGAVFLGMYDEVLSLMHKAHIS
ncbi:hypothetical protein CAPTEDRAFT_109350, partial [Capitella teleta]